jgi:hypothetical protein
LVAERCAELVEVQQHLKELHGDNEKVTVIEKQ